MADSSKIEWTDATWQVTRGCAQVSPGCTNCYAQAFAHRGLHESTRGLTRATANGARWTGEVRLAPDRLAKPLTWKKPRRIFVNSMSDLFHEDVPDEYIAAVFGVMAARPQHTFQVLTKRAERMAQWFAWHEQQVRKRDLHLARWRVCEDQAVELVPDLPAIGSNQPWPLPNVWLGVSVEDQRRADERIPHLLSVPAAVRFLSCEPMLGPVDFSNVTGRSDAVSQLGQKALRGIHWIIVGGESGPGARPFDLAWARSIVEQCRAAQVPVFCKQLGANPRAHAVGQLATVEPAALHLRDRKGGDIEEFPEDLRIREFPEVR